MFTYDVWPCILPCNEGKWLAARFLGIPGIDNCLDVVAFSSEEAAWAWVRMISYED